MNATKRLLTVGGIHVFETNAPCRLVRAAPADALEDLAWQQVLALRANKPGTGEIRCSTDVIQVDIVEPARLEIHPLEARAVRTGEKWLAQASLHDRLGRNLEVGKFSEFEWSCMGALELSPDRSAGEFGLCPTCFGMQSFIATKAGKGDIEVAFANLRGKYSVEVR